VLKQRDGKLAEAQQAQVDLMRKQRELDDAKREMELTIQKQVQAELGAVRDQAKQEVEAALTLRVREKEEQIASMQRQIEDLRRKAEQGSQQLQGEVQELALEALLRQKFPRDAFEPVGDEALCLLSFCSRDTTALFVELGRHLRVDGISGCGDLCLLVANGRFPTGNLGLLLCQLVLVPPARVFNQRRRQRFRQLDLRSATWASQGWSGHGSCLQT
jgi:hypothetical protein